MQAIIKVGVKNDSNLGNFSIFSFRLRIEIVEGTIFKIVSLKS